MHWVLGRPIFPKTNEIWRGQKTYLAQPSGLRNSVIHVHEPHNSHIILPWCQFPKNINFSKKNCFQISDLQTPSTQGGKTWHVDQQPSFRPAATAREVPSTVARGVRFQHRYHCRCRLLARRPPYAVFCTFTFFCLKSLNSHPHLTKKRFLNCVRTIYLQVVDVEQWWLNPWPTLSRGEN